MDNVSELQYLALAKKCLEEGVLETNRTGVRTKVLPPVFWSHDMRRGFPLLTTKKMAKKSIMVELEGFIGGITSKQWYKDRGCNIWNEWCNPKIVEPLRDAVIEGGKNCNVNYLLDIIKKTCKLYSIDTHLVYAKIDEFCEKYPSPEAMIKAVQFAADDLGPIYGYQWRRFNKPYEDGKPNTEPFPEPVTIKQCHEMGDQFALLIKTLKTNPTDRRMKVEAWNFQALSQQALPACHCGFTITKTGDFLNLHWEQR